MLPRKFPCGDSPTGCRSAARAMIHECHREEIVDDPFVDGHGSAVDDCVERDDGSLWVSNGEYGSRVNFCPFCGFEAKVKCTEP